MPSYDRPKRVREILDAANEFNVEDSAAVILAFALFSSDYFDRNERKDDFKNASAEQLAAAFPNISPMPADAKSFVGNSRSLADKLYAGRFGNAGQDDGWKYRQKRIFSYYRKGKL